MTRDTTLNFFLPAALQFQPIGEGTEEHDSWTHSQVVRLCRQLGECLSWSGENKNMAKSFSSYSVVFFLPQLISRLLWQSPTACTTLSESRRSESSADLRARMECTRMLRASSSSSSALCGLKFQPPFSSTVRWHAKIYRRGIEIFAFEFEFSARNGSGSFYFREHSSHRMSGEDWFMVFAAFVEAFKPIEMFDVLRKQRRHQISSTADDDWVAGKTDGEMTISNELFFDLAICRQATIHIYCQLWFYIPRSLISSDTFLITPTSFRFHVATEKSLLFKQTRRGAKALRA